MTNVIDAEVRAYVLAEVLRQIVLVPGPVTASAILKASRESFGTLRCGPEMFKALDVLVESGFISSNTLDRGFHITTNDTVFTPSPRITKFVWANDVELSPL